MIEGRRSVGIFSSLRVGATDEVPILPKPFVLQRKSAGVEVSIDAAELEGLSESELRQRFEAAKQAGGAGGAGQGGREDLSDYVAEEASKRRKLQGMIFRLSEMIVLLISFSSHFSPTRRIKKFKRQEGKLQILNCCQFCRFKFTRQADLTK